MSIKNNRVKIAATPKGGIECDCNEDFFIIALEAIVAAIIAIYASIKLIGVVVKKLDRWINGDDKSAKVNVDANKQSSPIASKEKEESLTDFSKPISQGEKVKFLVGDLFPEGGITLVAGAKGTGKSIFCMQIAQTLAKVGEHTLFNVNDADNTPSTVIYADYELNDRQIASRYPGLQNNTYFKWSHIENTNPTHVIKSLKKQLDNINTTSALIIIDNLTKNQRFIKPHQC